MVIGGAGCAHPLRRVLAGASPRPALRQSRLYRVLGGGSEQQTVAAGGQGQHRHERHRHDRRLGDLFHYPQTRGKGRRVPRHRAPRNVKIVWKNNLNEFAISPSGMNEYLGTAVNPLKRRLIPGGSSSGNAVALASGMADVAFGTDTAGSIRVPAACCGIVGLKTTYGLVSPEGVYPVEPRYLDTVGPMGKDIALTVQGMELLQEGFGAKYARAKAAKPSGPSIRIGRLKLKG